MNNLRTQFSARKLFFSIVFLFSAISLTSKESELITNIILINRQAELVEMDAAGEILRRFVVIPDYFSSGKSHNRSLRESLEVIKDYGSAEPDYFLPGDSNLPSECLQSFISKVDVPMEGPLFESVSTKRKINDLEKGINAPKNLAMIDFRKKDLTNDFSSSGLHSPNIPSDIAANNYFKKQRNEVVKRFPRDDTWYHHSKKTSKAAKKYEKTISV